MSFFAKHFIIIRQYNSSPDDTKGIFIFEHAFRPVMILTVNIYFV